MAQSKIDIILNLGPILHHLKVLKSLTKPQHHYLKG